MKNDFLKFLVLALVPGILPVSSIAQQLSDSVPLKVIIIRHGEKPDTGFNLSCEGFQRALVLPQVFTPLFGVPDYTYVPVIRTGKSTNSVRMYQTVTPFAVKHDLIINSKFDEKDSAGLAADILKKKGTVLIVWDRRNIPPIARNLGVKNKDLNWSDNDFDSIWIIDFIKTKKGRLRAKLSMAKENIIPQCK